MDSSTFAEGMGGLILMVAALAIGSVVNHMLETYGIVVLLFGHSALGIYFLIALVALFVWMMSKPYGHYRKEEKADE